MQYRISRLDFLLPQKKNREKHKNPLKVQMKLLGKGCLEKPQHEAMYTVCGCIVQYMKFLILKQHAVLYCTLLKLCILDLAVVPHGLTSSYFSTCIQQIASQRHYVHLSLIKIIDSKYSCIIFLLE